MKASGNYLDRTNNHNMFTSSDMDMDNEVAASLQSGGSIKSSDSLFTHLFSVDAQYKSEVINVLQFSFISLIPVVLLNKLIQHVIPEASTNSGNLEISMEIIGQVLLLIIGLVIINRFATYFTPYSGEPYPKFGVIYFVLGLLTVLVSIQSRLGEKINILFDRFMDALSGDKSSSSSSSSSKTRKGYKKQDTIPDVQVMGRIRPQSTDTTQLSALPVINQSLNTQPIQPTGNGYDQPQQYSTNYDANMRPPMINQEFPVSDEPTAANSMIGGSFGSIW